MRKGKMPMMTVYEVSARTGVGIRALRQYDRIGLLPPADVIPAFLLRTLDHPGVEFRQTGVVIVQSFRHQYHAPLSMIAHFPEMRKASASLRFAALY